MLIPFENNRKKARESVERERERESKQERERGKNATLHKTKPKHPSFVEY